MTVQNVYIPGDPYFICDECGRKRRKSEVGKRWDNAMVCKDTCLDQRNPQDFVKGRKDKLYVPNARPDVDIETSTITLSADVAQWSNTIIVSDVSHIEKKSPIGITFPDTSIQWTFVSADPVGTTLTLNDSLIKAAKSGATVYITYSSYTI